MEDVDGNSNSQEVEPGYVSSLETASQNTKLSLLHSIAKF